MALVAFLSERAIYFVCDGDTPVAARFGRNGFHIGVYTYEKRL